MNISVTILTKNSRRYLVEVLEALKAFDEVVIYDNGSTDETMEIAKRFSNVSLFQGDFLGFGPTHNVASGLAKHEWVLSVDSDEVISPEMVKEIQRLSLNANCIYSFPRQNFYRGKWIKGCGWYPDRQKKLYHRQKTQFTDDQVHETIDSTRMTVIPLKGHLRHYSYDSPQEFLQKMQSYSTLFAKQNEGKRQSSPLKAVIHGVFTFFKSYFLKRGFLSGYEGFLISAYMGHTAFYKYIKLYERNEELKHEN